MNNGRRGERLRGVGQTKGLRTELGWEKPHGSHRYYQFWIFWSFERERNSGRQIEEEEYRNSMWQTCVSCLTSSQPTSFCFLFCCWHYYRCSPLPFLHPLPAPTQHTRPQLHYLPPAFWLELFYGNQFKKVHGNPLSRASTRQVQKQDNPWPMGQGSQWINNDILLHGSSTIYMVPTTVTDGFCSNCPRQNQDNSIHLGYLCQFPSVHSTWSPHFTQLEPHSYTQAPLSGGTYLK